MSEKTEMVGEVLSKILDQLESGPERGAVMEYMVERFAVELQVRGENFSAQEEADGERAACVFVTAQMFKESLEHSLAHVQKAMDITLKVAPAYYGLNSQDPAKVNLERAVAAAEQEEAVNQMPIICPNPRVAKS